MLDLPLYILAGGQSRRFGSDKARALLDGTPLIVRVAAALQEVTHGVTVVADRAQKYADLGLRTIADLQPGRGPLGGLLTALDDRRRGLGEGWLLLASCDLVQPDAALVRLLTERTGENLEAVCFRGERLEPMLALYHTRLIDRVTSQLQQGRGAMHELIAASTAQVIGLPDGGAALRQANTPAALRSEYPPNLSSG